MAAPLRLAAALLGAPAVLHSLLAARIALLGRHPPGSSLGPGMVQLQLRLYRMEGALLMPGGHSQTAPSNRGCRG